MLKSVINSIGVLFLMSLSANAQEKINISGYVKNKGNGERLIGATVIEAGTSNGTFTDYNGYFNLVVQNPSLRFSYIGFVDQIFNLDTDKDTILEVTLIEDIEQLSEVTVSASKNRNPNIATLNYAQMNQTPSLFGKPDVVKTLQLLPGISSQKEGSSLMIVRGGDPGQNLYLFDNVPVMYVNHLGGFMSVFNPDIINNIDVYKGGFPSRYGGKLASVMDITQREGDYSTYKGSLSAGLTDISFNIEGPTRIKNSSFIIGARKTLFETLMIIPQLLQSEGRDYMLAYGFHDINGKFSWKPDNKNSLSLNFYHGDDYINIWSLTKEKYRMVDIWGNWLVSAKYNSILSSKLFSSTTLSFTRYRLKEFMKYNLQNVDKTVTQKNIYKSSVRDLAFRSGMKYTASDKWLIDFGIQGSFLSMIPNDTYISTQKVQKEVEPFNSFDYAIYADNKFTINKLSITPGFRFNNHLADGYSDFSFEPRLNASLQVSENHSISMNYMKVSQYSHLVFTTGNIMNNEVWIPAGKEIPPAKSDQYNLGWNGTFMNGMFSADVSLYYKEMYNLSSYREGYTNLMGDENWITKVETGGKGRSAGIEFLVKKNSGNWTGFLSYVYSKTTRQYANINGGKQYVFDYDRPNNLSLNLNRKIKSNLNLNIVWVYQSGLPYTEAIGRQYIPSVVGDFKGNDYFYEGLIYGERNGGRMKDYHRLDVGLTWTHYNRKNNKVDWNFSVYNLYNRHNPVFYYYKDNPLSLYQTSLFPVMPSVSYKVYFDPQAKEARIASQRVHDPQKAEEIGKGGAVFSDGSYIKRRLNIKAGYSYEITENDLEVGYRRYYLDLKYGFLKNIEGGIYCGYTGPPATYSSRGAYIYGLGCNIHFLPFILKKKEPILDLYFTGKLGCSSFKSYRTYEDHSIGTGATIYLSKHIGIFGEYDFDYSKLYYNHLKKRINFGLSLKFR